MPPETAQIETRPPGDTVAKAIGKMRLLTLGDLDGRTLAARRARELIDGIEADLGGSDRLSEGSRQLVQRAAVLGAIVENCETRWLGGHPVDLGDYLAAINAQRRVLTTLGLERRPRDVTPSLHEYLLRPPHDEDTEDAEDADEVRDPIAGEGAA